jgi:hypothetical protein
MPNDPSPLVVYGIGGLAVVVAALVIAGLARAGVGRRGLVVALVVAALWMGLTGLAAASGLLLRADVRPPPLALALVLSVALGAYVGLSKVGRVLADGVPLVALVGLQAFRLPLELVMHQAAVKGTMPVQMSFSGDNFDIVTGAGAVVVAVLLATGRAPLWIVGLWNTMGAALLLTIMTIAVASTPAFHAFGTDPAHVNTFVARFPFVWLPAVLVATALAGHIVIARRLQASLKVQAAAK